MIPITAVALTLLAVALIWWALVTRDQADVDLPADDEFEQCIADALAVLRVEDTAVIALAVCQMCDPRGGHPDDVLCPDCLRTIAAQADEPIPYMPTPYVTVPRARHGRHR